MKSKRINYVLTIGSLVTILVVASATSAQTFGPGAGMGMGRGMGMGPMVISNGDPAVGSRVATQVCAACHSADGNSTQAAFPKLAGQKESYLYGQLRNFASGARKNEIMAGIVAGLNDEAMQDAAAYFSRQSVKPGIPETVTANARLAEAGGVLFAYGDPSRRIPACVICHGDGPNMGRHATFPLLQGQHAEYIATQLVALKSGTRTQAMMMPMIASRLGDGDIKAVATYLAGAR